MFASTLRDRGGRDAFLTIWEHNNGSVEEGEGGCRPAECDKFNRWGSMVGIETFPAAVQPDYRSEAGLQGTKDSRMIFTEKDFVLNLQSSLCSSNTIFSYSTAAA